MGKISLIVSVFLLFSCGYRFPLRHKESIEKASLPELVYSSQVVVVPKEPPEDKGGAEYTDFGGPGAKEVLSRGWRIQLATANDQNEAKEIRDEAERKLGVRVYIQYSAPIYKIRAGDFTDRDAALELCEKAKRLGFPDAYPIPSEIIVRE